MNARSSLCTVAGAYALFWAGAAAAQSPASVEGLRSNASSNSPQCVTGDSLLDHPAMRDLLHLLWTHSNADAAARERREQVGFLFDSAGVMFYRADLNNPANTPCRSSCVVPLTGRGLAAAATHPFRPGELLPPSCTPNPAERRVYSVDRFGGASELDLMASWDWGVPIYIIDKDNVYRIPQGTTRENASSAVKRYPRVDPENGCGII